MYSVELVSSYVSAGMISGLVPARALQFVESDLRFVVHVGKERPRPSVIYERRSEKEDMMEADGEAALGHLRCENLEVLTV